MILCPLHNNPLGRAMMSYSVPCLPGQSFKLRHLQCVLHRDDIVTKVVRVSIHETLVGPVILRVPLNGSGRMVEQAMVAVPDDTLDAFDFQATLVDGTAVIRVHRG